MNWKYELRKALVVVPVAVIAGICVLSDKLEDIGAGLCHWAERSPWPGKTK